MLQYNFLHLTLGGVPEDVAEATSDLYTSGLDGCVIQLRSALVPNRWEEVSLRQAATSGRAITPCLV